MRTTNEIIGGYVAYGVVVGMILTYLAASVRREQKNNHEQEEN